MPGRTVGRARVLLVAAVAACAGGNLTSEVENDATPSHALSDGGSWRYLGFEGGQYPGAAMPSAHRAAGTARANAVVPLDLGGNPSSSGKIVLLSIGMSNTTQEFCNPTGSGQCATGTLVQQALADPAVQKVSLVLVDGARGGQSAGTWLNPTDPNYDQVRDTRLAPAGASERQVQVVWLKVANPGPTVSLPSLGADAYLLVNQMGSIVRTLRIRYPNLKLVFFSNRTYGGYATTSLNPEPFAYESGFAVKWTIAAQITQMETGQPDARAGNLDYTSMAPWLGWGPDLWANGTLGRADGLNWTRDDFGSDGTHPSAAGVQKVGRQLLDFFKQSPLARCWFITGGSCS